MKIALIGSQIPFHLPGFLADALFAHRVPCTLYLLEKNEAMAGLIEAYAQTLIRHGGSPVQFCTSSNLDEVLQDADGVIFAGEVQAASRFQMDRSYLKGEEETPSPLMDQARVSGGIGGLLHTLRTGEAVYILGEKMKSLCPKAFIINLSLPLGRMTLLLHQMGFRVLGMGYSALRGPQGANQLDNLLSLKKESIQFEAAGLNQFSWLCSLRHRLTGEDLLGRAKLQILEGRWGTLCTRLTDWYDAVPLGDVQNHAQFLPAQEAYTPPENPALSEDVPTRKARILHINTVAQKGLKSQEGNEAQLALLKTTSPDRPIQCLLALLSGTSLSLNAVTQINQGILPQLPMDCAVEAPLTIDQGKVSAITPITLPIGAAGLCRELAQTDILAAQASTGDREALRSCVEIDPALSGLDRLYCLEVVHQLIDRQLDILPRFA